MGLNLESVWIMIGVEVKGKKTPDRKIIGKNTKFIMPWNPCCDLILAAITKPTPDSVIESSRIIGINFRMRIGVIFIPISGANPSKINPRIEEVKAPPNALPSIIPVLLNGAISNSFKNPNSLSHTIDNAEKSDRMTTVIARIPGNIN